MWKEKIQEGYFTPRDHFVEIEALSMKRDEVDIDMKGIDVSSTSKALLVIHWGGDDVTRLGLGEQEPWSNMGIMAKQVPFVTHDGKGEFLPGGRHKTPDGTTVRGERTRRRSP